MDHRRDPLLVAVDRALREATQRYEQRPTPEHARVAAADEVITAAQQIRRTIRSRAVPSARRRNSWRRPFDGLPAGLREAVPVVRIGRLVRVLRGALLR